MFTRTQLHTNAVTAIFAAALFYGCQSASEISSDSQTDRHRRAPRPLMAATSLGVSTLSTTRRPGCPHRR